MSDRHIEIPGGWVMKIPSIALDPKEEEMYARYLKSRGVLEKDALPSVRKAMQQMFNRAWGASLRLMLLQRAREYKKMHPDLGMRGFNPEELQVCYMPGEKTGQAGKPFVKAMLVEMGRRQREKEEMGR